MARYMLTTLDNPYNPFTHYREWFSFDLRANYNTPSLLGRMVINSYEMSEADQEQAIEMAIDEIVRENVLGIYRKVRAPDKEK